MPQSIQEIHTPALPLWLTAAGALPFLGSAFLLVSGIDLIGAELAVIDLLASYALVIGIFLCGIHWGHGLSLGTPGINLFALSNLATLLLWCGWLFLSRQGFLLLAFFHFWLMWGVDYRLSLAGQYKPDYFSARTLITTVVSICLLAAFLVK